MNDYLVPLVEQFEDHGDGRTAVGMAKYMRNKFEFLGIKTPLRKDLVKQYVAGHGLPPAEDLEPVVRGLWDLPHREFQYVAQDLMQRMRKQIAPEHGPMLQHLIVTKSWWDTVDALASHQVGGLLADYPALRDDLIGRWRKSPDIWLRRTTLLFQLRYKEMTDQALLFDLVEENLGSDEFFINKAIGWALREYSKTDSEAVVAFVEKTALQPLSEREALKWMKNQGMLS